MEPIDPTVRCDRSDHDHASLEEARQCYRDEVAEQSFGECGE